jgi:hypothetical protein
MTLNEAVWILVDFTGFLIFNSRYLQFLWMDFEDESFVDSRDCP